MKTTITIELSAGEALESTTTIADLILADPSKPNGSTQKSQPGADPEAAFKAKFGSPLPSVIVLKKGDDNFDDDKNLIKRTQLYRWDKDHNNGTGQPGAWVLKQ